MCDRLIQEAIILLLRKGCEYEDIQYSIAKRSLRPLAEIKKNLHTVVSTGNNFIKTYSLLDA